MAERQFHFGKGAGGAALPVKVVPRASKNEIVGLGPDGALKIRVTAPPVDGAANEAVIELLAKALGLPKSKVDIVGGFTNTSKLVSLLGIDPALVDKLLKINRTATAERPQPAALAEKPGKARQKKKK